MGRKACHGFLIEQNRYLTKCFSSIDSIITIPSNPTIMHHHAILAPPIWPSDLFISFRAFSPEISAMTDPIPASQTNENANPKESY